MPTTQRRNPAQAQKLRRQSRSPEQAPKSSRRSRSPAQAPQEIAAGEEFAEGAMDVDSTEEDTDSDSEEPPLQDRFPTSDHAIRITQEAVAASPNVIANFISQKKHRDLEKFCDRLNAQIRKANKQRGLNIDKGTIPYGSYRGLLQGYGEAFVHYTNNTDHEKAWDQFNKTYKLIAALNIRHWIPPDWNLHESWAEEQISLPNPDPIKYHLPPLLEEEELDRRSIEKEEANELLSSIETDEETTSVEDLGALESRTWEEQRQMSSGTVLYWWPKAQGHRPSLYMGAHLHLSIESGLVLMRSKVERVLISKTRGTAREVDEDDDGVLDEHRKYSRSDVAGILGIGWKMDGDDEDGINPLLLLQPTKGGLYPQTRALVKWRDGTRTVEGRSFIRRITMGSSLDGDKTIYQKAVEMEKAYRKDQGLDDYEDDFTS
ncbi:hypothetical protein N7471_013457 [Penicillium samsonianum]|uniref:uncharacterized protein n=1 Tax=Penicillium samsonianum TaxID=1882272 RepID=UPI002549633F|nr:uncharacterized protein N7471_013457 [Penicillium samsonianum]KAJ6118837.1 hypothetical protein N7471_013457 [Penicillium samsonianum]